MWAATGGDDYALLAALPAGFDPLGLSLPSRTIVEPIGTLTDTGLFIADVETGRLARLPASGEPIYPRWSPDGDWVAFVAMRNARWELARQRADGSGAPETILPGQWWISDWSPDGRAPVANADDPDVALADRREEPMAAVQAIASG